MTEPSENPADSMPWTGPFTAELIALIYVKIRERGGTVDRIHLEIDGTDTVTGEPIHLRIGGDSAI